MIACSVIAILSSTASGAADPSVAGTLSRSARESAASPRVAPVHCSAARKAVRYYRSRVAFWNSRMGTRDEASPNARRLTPCPRYLAKVLQRKAHAAHKVFTRWHRYHYEWASWLPDKWARIGACETGYGRRPGSWTWDSGTYVSAFGIYRAGYSQFAHEIGQLSWDETRSRLGRYPTPREQFNVALRIYWHYGFSGWGCRNA